MASNTIPFQPAYSLNPKYGFRYGPSTFVGSTTKAGGNPVSNLDLSSYDSSSVPPLNNPTVTSGNSTMDGGDSDNGSAQAGIDMSTQASIANKGIQADTDPNMIASSLVGFLGTAAGVPLSGAAGFGTVPRDGYTGSEGTIGPNGGMFNSAGREIDQTTGQAYNSYGSASQFYNGTYMSNIKDQNTIGGMLGAAFSDPDNAFGYDRSANAASQHMQFAEGNRPSTALEDIAFDDLNLGMTQAQKNANATQQGFDMGIPAHSMEVGSATHNALLGGVTTGATAPAGSQYSKDGRFTTEIADTITTTPTNNTNYSTPASQQSYSNNDGQDSNNNDNNTGGGGSNDYGGMFNAGGLVPPPNMGKRAQDVPNPMMQDPFGDLFRRT
jgi:hypothetical protein